MKLVYLKDIVGAGVCVYSLAALNSMENGMLIVCGVTFFWLCIMVKMV